MSHQCIQPGRSLARTSFGARLASLAICCNMKTCMQGPGPKLCSNFGEGSGNSVTLEPPAIIKTTTIEIKHNIAKPKTWRPTAEPKEPERSLGNDRGPNSPKWLLKQPSENVKTKALPQNLQSFKSRERTSKHTLCTCLILGLAERGFGFAFRLRGLAFPAARATAPIKRAIGGHPHKTSCQVNGCEV